ncbi:MAG: fumarylacetoacetate hydrolase family protein [Veillonella sp.]
MFTGTPSGVVLGKNEKRYGWLKSGDTVSISISGIGTLVNQFK